MISEKTWRDISEAFESGASEFVNDEVKAFNTAAGLPPIREARADEPLPRFEIRRRRDQRSTLDEAQAFVGGWVELVEVRLPAGDGQWIEGQLLGNDEARLLDMPRNPLASATYGRPFAGPALLLLGDARWE